MKRRDVIAGLMVAYTLGDAHAQQTKKYRIAILDPATPVQVMNGPPARNIPSGGHSSKNCVVSVTSKGKTFS